jgi:predicted phosphoadenosine phosphosulfate sulfurtransferase
LGYRSFTLPEGHTWKSFTLFLLDTLPKEVAENFKRRFAQSILYWARTGITVPEEVAADLERIGVPHKINSTPAQLARSNTRRVIIVKVPDHLDELRAHPSTIQSWKRFAITILKNDHTCKYLKYAPTQEQQARQREIQAKYRSLNNGKAETE